MNFLSTLSKEHFDESAVVVQRKLPPSDATLREEQRSEPQGSASLNCMEPHVQRFPQLWAEG